MQPRSRKNGVRVGDPAPDFILLSQSGERFDLKEIIGKKNLVLYFYPRDGTRGCTAEACAFREAYEEIKERGAEVIGVSSDSVESHRSFSSRHGIPFRLLADISGDVRRLYGTPSTLGLIPGRVTYVIDKQGMVRRIVSSQFNPRKHVEDALRAVSALQSE